MRDLIQDSANRLLSDHVTSAARMAGWRGEWNQALWELLEQSGFTRALCGADAGGSDASWSDIYPLLTACGYHQLPLPLPETLLVNRLLENARLDEPGGLVGLAEVGSAADGTPGVYAIVPWGRKCGYILAPASDLDDAIALYSAAELDFEFGVNLAREPRDRCRLDHVAPVAIGRLPRAADTIRLYGALIRSAQSAGAAQSAIEQAVRYAGERVQFGRTLAKFQAVQHNVAVAVSEVAALNAATEYACGAEENQKELAITVAKITASETGDVVADIAHAIHGAIGYTVEHRLHHATQRLRSWSDEFGNARWWSVRLGRAVCRRGASSLIPSLVDGGFPIVSERAG